MSVLTELQEAVAAVATAAAPSVVGIGSRTRGSGVVIADGAVLTNAHNLRGGEVTVRFADGRATRGTVAGVDWDGDLAVVTVDTAGTHADRLVGGGATIGSAVFAAAATPSGGARVSFGFVSSVERAFRGPGGRRISGSLEHTAPLAPGSSGSALLDADGRARRPQHEPGRRGLLPRAAGRRVAEVAGRCPRPRRVQGAPAAGHRGRAGARLAPAAPVGRAARSVTACSSVASRTARRGRGAGSPRATCSSRPAGKAIDDVDAIHEILRDAGFPLELTLVRAPRSGPSRSRRRRRPTASAGGGEGEAPSGPDEATRLSAAGPLNVRAASQAAQPGGLALDLHRDRHVPAEPAGTSPVGATTTRNMMSPWVEAP